METRPIMSESILGNLIVGTCDCVHCKESRWLGGIADLLPDDKAKELREWYCALLDCRENEGMEFYWIQQHLKELTEIIQSFGARRKSA